MHTPKSELGVQNATENPAEKPTSMPIWPLCDCPLVTNGREHTEGNESVIALMLKLLLVRVTALSTGCRAIGCTALTDEPPSDVGMPADAKAPNDDDF